MEAPPHLSGFRIQGLGFCGCSAISSLRSHIAYRKQEVIIAVAVVVAAAVVTTRITVGVRGIVVATINVGK